MQSKRTPEGNTDSDTVLTADTDVKKTGFIGKQNGKRTEHKRNRLYKSQTKIIKLMLRLVIVKKILKNGNYGFSRFRRVYNKKNHKAYNDSYKRTEYS